MSSRRRVNQHDPSAPSAPTVQDPKVAKCDACGFIAKSGYVLATHMFREHGEGFRCRHDDCGLTFLKPSELKKHVERVHEQVEKPHACEICGTRYHERSNLRTHVAMVHEKKRPHVCDDCGAAYSSKQNLGKHVLKKHGKALPAEGPLPCPVDNCGLQ
jgi:uncharacterized Zn-finger protein